MQYFEHDSEASTDQKIMSLRVTCGNAGVDTYWYLIEQMHKDERGLCKDDVRAMRAHCHILCITEKEFSTIVEELILIDLMYVDDDGCLWSERAKENIEKYHKKSETSRSNARKRWGNKNGNAGDMQPHSDGSATTMLTKQNKTKVSTTKRSTKPFASGDAAVAGATPPSGKDPYCPLCEAKVWPNKQTGKYDCSKCYDTFDRGKVVWR
ncbi:MAG: DUF4373 domain-containing protein [Gordonibacter sp.]|uniref:Lin1244/Lin1753 domain-containing protein n=1 Tax=Gordonibacter sp. TaxID=1968902 RepID=UPI002FC77C90